MINDQPWKPGGSILLRSIEPCPGNQLRSLFHKSGPGDPWGWGPARKNLTVDLLWTSWRAKGFTTRSSLETERDDGLPIMGTPNRNEPSGTVELCWRCQTHHLNSSETKWWLDDPPKVAGYTAFMKLPHWPRHRLFLTTLCFGVGGNLSKTDTGRKEPATCC
jgi:hypothetical protein